MDFDAAEMSAKEEYCVYIQHVTNRSVRKTVKASSLLNLKGRDFTTFKPTNVRDFKRNVDYGKHEDGKMAQYNIIHMTGELLRIFAIKLPWMVFASV